MSLHWEKSAVQRKRQHSRRIAAIELSVQLISICHGEPQEKWQSDARCSLLHVLVFIVADKYFGAEDVIKWYCTFITFKAVVLFLKIEMIQVE